MIDQPAGLARRVAIVTGAGQGLGRAFARAFAEAGAISIVAEIDKARGENTAHEIEEAGGKAMPVVADVGSEQSVDSMVHAVIAKFGRIDILVNNAAIFSTLKMRPFTEIPLDEWERVLRVNITGTYLCCRAVAAPMKSRKWGRIINISSASITLGRPNYLHYTTSKSAIVGMSRSMARELGPSGITVNTILPGATFTEIPRETVTDAQKAQLIAMQCVPRAQTPVDLVSTVMFLASEGSSFVTGQSITVDGGCTHG
jgi:NAD(P)-dependent dehydrogenase (short-subunit alcohol dehydrogenase family)